MVPFSLSAVHFWHPVLTDHQSYTLQAAAALMDAEVRVVVRRKLDAERTAQGWKSNHAHALDLRLIDGWNCWLKALAYILRHRRATHVFGSPFDTPSFMLALFAARIFGIRYFLISEPYSTSGLGYLSDRNSFVAQVKAKFRPAVYRIYGTVLAEGAGGILAISRRAVEQFQAIGFKPTNIFPFGYFIPRLVAGSAIPTDKQGYLRVVFVGSLVKTKGLDILIAAVDSAQADGANVSLDIYGPGDIHQYGILPERCTYRETIPFGASQNIIQEYDLLVLPSRYDGWGVVVNEAINASVPVVCSVNVGAGCIVEKWGCGLVFGASAADLKRALLRCTTDPNLLGSMRQACLGAQKAIRPEIAGEYLAGVLRGSPVTNEWY